MTPQPQYHPEFLKALQELDRLRRELGEAQYDKDPRVIQCMVKALRYAPDDLKAVVDAKARELDLYPAASGYLDNGEPVFSDVQIAEKLGVSLEEVHATIAKNPDVCLPAGTVIHRPQ